MTSLERVVAALQHKEADRVPCVPLICGTSRRVYGVTYAEWAQDSLEAADFGQEVVYPVENTPHPNYDNPLIKNPDDYSKLERFDPTKSPRMKEQLKYYDILMNERLLCPGVPATLSFSTKFSI